MFLYIYWVRDWISNHPLYSLFCSCHLSILGGTHSYPTIRHASSSWMVLDSPTSVPSKGLLHCKFDSGLPTHPLSIHLSTPFSQGPFPLSYTFSDFWFPSYPYSRIDTRHTFRPWTLLCPDFSIRSDLVNSRVIVKFNIWNKILIMFDLIFRLSNIVYIINYKHYVAPMCLTFLIEYFSFMLTSLTTCWDI